MEIVKIDAEKLQLLNDRVSQTIDALNQVRLSTHGLQHSSGQPGASQWGPTQLGAQQQVAPTAFYGQAVPVQAMPVQTMPVQTMPVQTMPVQTIPAGLEHSAPVFDPSLGQVAFTSAGGPVGFAPAIAQGAFASTLGPAQQTFRTRSMGISHTAPVVDPYWHLRGPVPIPYPQYAIPQVMSY